MPQEFLGYQIIEQLYEGEHSQLLRAYRQSDQQPIIIKILKDKYPTVDQIIGFKREYQITRDFSEEDIIRAYAIEKYQNTFAIIVEDFGGQALGQILKTEKLSLRSFLTLAIKIVTAIEHVHAHAVIHKDINPSNIVWNQKTDTLKLIDFGISTNLPREKPEITNPNTLEGTIAYISPEQTGRMNRGIDYRTDFYSLGVTLYEMLTRRLPFESSDPMEMVHYHIARQPVSAHEIDPTIPEILSDIIMKLMSKMAEDRYQSAHGIKVDLINCLNELKKTDTITRFPLGRQDFSERFHIPEKLYGRELEIETLLNAYTEVSQGAAKLLLVSGYSGIGKSALIHEVHKPLVEKKGYFIAGKFDQFKQNIPYAALVQALTEWIRQVFMEGPAMVSYWQSRLQSALESNTGLMVELIPALESLLGTQPKPTPLNPIESQNRFKMVFVKFLQTLATDKHPLVIFLDDLQWADAASLQLLLQLLMHSESHNLFIIGAYRDNEVDKAHLLTLTINELVKAKIEISTIHLQPLLQSDIAQLLADTLCTNIHDVQALAKLCYRKTNGNPFFINQLLLVLYQEGLIYLSHDRSNWEWDISKIEAKGVTDNVVELMTNKLEQLNPETRRALQLAACIGHRFTLNLLEVVHGKSFINTANDLWQALEEGLIVPENEAYKYVNQLAELEESVQRPQIIYRFLHDRVQQAAYTSIDEQQRQSIHYQISQLLLGITPTDKVAENIFVIVNQLNAGLALIKTNNEQKQLVDLNLLAGHRAKDASAFKSAVNYLQIAKNYLIGNSWEDNYELTLDINKTLVEALFINAQVTQADQVIDEILRHVKTNVEKADIYCMRVMQYSSTHKLEEAINQGLFGLKLLGINLQKKPGKLTVLKEMLLCSIFLGRRRIPDLINAPIIDDPRIICSLRLLNEIRPCAYLAGNPILFVALILISAKLVLRYGSSIESAQGYISYAMFLQTVLGKYKKAYEFAQLALALNAKLNDLTYRCRIVSSYALFIHPWNESWHTIQQNCQKAIEAGLQLGDINWIAGSCHNAVIWNPEIPQNQLIEEAKKYLKIIAQTGYQDGLDSATIAVQFRINLAGGTRDYFSLSNDTFNEDECLQRLITNKYYSGVTVYYIFKAIINYLYGRMNEAWQCLQKSDQTIASLMSTPYQAEHCFYSFLICAAMQTEYPEQTTDWLQRMKKELRTMKKWSDHCPGNFEHKKLLMLAEMTRLQGNKRRAGSYYDLAIVTAKKNNFLNIVALANELAAKHYSNSTQEHVAKVYFIEAHYAYTQWGAVGKVKHLEENNPELISYGFVNPPKPTTKVTTSLTTTSQTFDLDTVIKASQAISGEIILPTLLKKMMRIVIENAGAEKGWLILEKNGQWLIEAEGDVESKEVKILQSLPMDALPVAIINAAIYNKQSIVLDNAAKSTEFAADHYVQLTQPKSILCMPLLNQGNLIGLLYLENNLATNAFTETRINILTMLTSQIAISVYNARLYENLSNVNKSNARFVPQEFLNLLGKNSTFDVTIGDVVEKDMTILFCDIRNSTFLSEKMTPKENFIFINEFVSHMETEIYKHLGFVDKYMGDGIMALFPSDADSAVRAALGMGRALMIYNMVRQENNQDIIQIGIGLNSGHLMLGMVGGKNRMDGTVISDAVNIASRVEELTKIYQAFLFITDETYSRLENPDSYYIRKIYADVVRGKTVPTIVYEIYDLDPANVRELKQQTANEVEQAIALYQSKQFAQALLIFEKILQINPHDGPVKIYYELCTQSKHI